MKTLGDIKKVLLQRDLLKEVSGETEDRLCCILDFCFWPAFCRASWSR